MTDKLFIEILGTVSDEGFTPAPMVVSLRTSEPRILVGRRPDNRLEASLHLFLSSLTVSPCHALIYRVDNRWHVRDLSSENGTKIYSNPPHAGYISEITIEKSVEVQFGWVVVRLTDEAHS